MPVAWANPEGGGGGGRDADHPPQKKHISIGFLSNTGLDPLKNHKANNQYSVSSHQGWWADNCPLLVLFGSPHSFKKQNKTRARSRWGAIANPHAKVFDSPPQHHLVPPRGMTLATE